MGACFIISDTNTKIIDNNMKRDDATDKEYHKLLFLGPGGGGKSTIFKQLQWLHGGGFTVNDIETLKKQIHLQLITQTQAVIKHYLSQPTSDAHLQTEIDIVRNANFRFTNDPTFKSWSELSPHVAFIWENDERLKGIFDAHDSQHIIWQSTEYFLNELPRICAPDYKPTKLDIIKVRNMSTGVVQKRFAIDKCNFHIFDVGGQKSERKKWICCFDNVSVIVYVASLSCYNELMFEDKSTNSMVDAVELFDKTINNPQFVETPVILFLNKTDLFRRKIKTIPITTCPLFDDLGGKISEEREDVNDEYRFNENAKLIKNKFEAMNGAKRSCYTHLTCAMDGDNIRNVFNDIVDIVVGTLSGIISEQHLL